jgi:tRNA(Ile)-lysidine synthetase-like protein
VVRQLFPGQSLERVEAVLDFIQSREYGVLQLPGQVLRREQGRLYFEEERAARLPARRVIPGETLSIPEAGLRLVTEFTVYRGEIHDLFKTSFLKYEILSTDLLCTGRMPGDSIRPHGRGVRKKLSALFKEAGYTRAQREGCPVLRDANGPLFVRGLAIDERAAPQPGERALKLSFFEAEAK